MNLKICFLCGKDSSKLNGNGLCNECNPYKGLECPMCNKWGIIVDNETETGLCPHCGEEYCQDDICPECEKLVKGSCYYCKMD